MQRVADTFAPGANVSALRVFTDWTFPALWMALQSVFIENSRAAGGGWHRNNRVHAL